jgi:hypothetical protein
MKARHLEAVLRAAHAVNDSRNIDDLNDARPHLRVALKLADPHGVYKPQAPQAPGVDLEETQDIPLSDSPRLRRLPGESGDAT